MSIFSELARAEKENKFFCLVTITETEGSVARGPGTQMIVFEDASLIGTVGGGVVEQSAKKDAISTILSGKPMSKKYLISADGPKGDVLHGSVTCFLQPHLPSKKLYLFGAGHVAQEIIPLAKLAGFHITVVDPREELYRTVNAKLADRYILDDYSLIDKMIFDEQSYIFIGTYDHGIDGLLLGKALRSGARYVGMIGGKPKIKTIFTNLRAQGFSEEELQKAHTPAGLDIGGEDPAQIAISIVAELMAVSAGKNGGFCKIS